MVDVYKTRLSLLSAQKVVFWLDALKTSRRENGKRATSSESSSPAALGAVQNKSDSRDGRKVLTGRVIRI
jgi:hypothetical protein